MEDGDMYESTQIARIKRDPKALQLATDALASNIAHVERMIAAFRQAEVFRVVAITFGLSSGNGVDSHEIGEWNFNADDEFNEPDDPELRGAMLAALMRVLHDRRTDLAALGVGRARLQ
jgi:hypothetical protein